MALPFLYVMLLQKNKTKQNPTAIWGLTKCLIYGHGIPCLYFFPSTGV
jgi:hypothetical protein